MSVIIPGRMRDWFDRSGSFTLQAMRFFEDLSGMSNDSEIEIVTLKVNMSNLDWIRLASNVEYVGVQTNVTNGVVYEASYTGYPVYRFVSTQLGENNYPDEDSFYLNFNGSELTTLITKRG